MTLMNVALLCGFGGGNFASSMSNISFFVPKKEKGNALALNAGIVWAPILLIATVAAWFGMNDVASLKASLKERSIIFKRRHNWIMCVLFGRVPLVG